MNFDLYLKAFQSVLIPFIAGYSVMLSIFKNQRLPILFLCSLSYGMGMGILTHVMLILGIFQIPFSFNTISYILCFISLLSIGLSRMNKSSSISRLTLSFSPPLTRWNLLLFWLSCIYIFYIVIHVFWRSFNIPLKDWDAISFIGYKGMVFFYTKSLFQHADLPHASYPLHTSFAEAWVAFNLGRWDHILVKTIFPAYFLSMLFMMYSFLRIWVSRLKAVFGLVLILSSNILVYHATNGYKDFVVMFYNCSVVIILLVWQKQKNTEFLILSSLMAGLSSFIKNEAALYLSVYYLLLSFILLTDHSIKLSEKIKKFFLYLIPSLGICCIYQAYRLSSGIVIKTYDTNLGFSTDHLHRLPEILTMLANNLFTSAGWNFVWFLFFLSLLQYKKIFKDRSLCTIVLSVFSFLGLYAVGLLLSPQYAFFKEVSQFTVLSRVVLHFFPLSALAIVLINGIDDEANVTMASPS